MLIQEKTEQKIAHNNPIVPENGALSNYTSLTQTEVETSKATKTQTKTWTGRVSLDNHQYQNKPKNDIGRINNAIANGATDIDEDGLIKAITSGQSWSPTTFNGKRDREHFVEMSALVTDFDNGFQSFEEIKTRAEEHDLKFSFVHESFSHTLARPKYRGVILLEQPIKDYETAKFYCEYIKHVFKGFVDTSAAEPTRFYYGGREGSLVFQNKGQILSLSLLEKMMEKNEPASNSIRLTPSEFQPDNLENPGSFEVFQQLLKDDYHQFIKEVGADSMAFLASLANIDDANTLLKIDVNDKTIPAKYRLVVHWIEEANKLQEQTNVLNPLPGNKVPPLSNASPDDQEKYQRHQDYIKKVRNQRKQAPIVQKAFDNICSRMIRFDVSKSRFTFDDDTVVVWTDIKKLMKEVLAVRKKPFYDGLIHNNLRNIDYDHIIDRLSLDNIYYPQQHWAQNLPPWDGNDRYRLLADTFRLDIESNEFKIVLTWFKGTMNRWLVPGTKHDNVLVLQGKQGRGKSTFFAKLAPSFATGHDTSDKDSLLKYHKYGLIEFDELDGLTKKADVAALKKFFSQQEDDIRPPYGRESMLLKRAYACCASVNTGNFLKDATGNRRFITISVGSKYIDSSWLDDENEKHQFWAQVKEDMELLGYIPRELEKVQVEMNQGFVHEDTDTEAIVEFIDSLSDEEKEGGFFRWKDPRSAHRNEEKVPLTKYRVALQVFGTEGVSRSGTQRADKMVGGKIHNVLVNKLGFVYKSKKIEKQTHKVYCVEG